MACGCVTYECRDVLLNPCLIAINTGIESTIDGEVNGMIEFNGGWTTFSVSVNAGSDIYLPVDLFNEFYVHELRLTQDSETTCYKINTLFSSNNTTPIIDNTMWQWARITGIAAGTMIVTDSRLTGDLSPQIWINGEGYDYLLSGFSHTANGIDFTSVGGFPGGVLSFQYKNLPI